MRNSTSIHNLNGDRRLNRSERKLYNILNRLNNILPNSFMDKQLTIKDYSTTQLDAYWDEIAIKSSPSRKLSDLFWKTLSWNKINKELGDVNIFDTGCGTGNYGVKMLENSSPNGINSYFGVDIKEREEWNKLKSEYSNFDFKELNGTEIDKYIGSDVNLFISQSAIEHFEENLTYFRKIANYINTTKKSIIQIHLFPAKSGLKKWQFHGIRQYSPKTVSIISKLFQSNSYSTLYKLGGHNCNELHYQFITKPIMEGTGDLRETRTEEYDKQLKIAVEKDMQTSSNDPSFYALIIHSNFNKRIF